MGGHALSIPLTPSRNASTLREVSRALRGEIRNQWLGSDDTALIHIGTERESNEIPCTIDFWFNESVDWPLEEAKHELVLSLAMERDRIVRKLADLGFRVDASKWPQLLDEIHRSDCDRCGDLAADVGLAEFAGAEKNVELLSIISGEKYGDPVLLRVPGGNWLAARGSMIVYRASSLRGPWSETRPFDSWSQTTSVKLGATAKSCTVLLYSQRRDRPVLSSTSLDGGVTWKPAKELPLPPLGTTDRLICDPNSSERLWASCRGQLWASWDGGQSFEEISKKPTFDGRAILDFHEVAALSDEVLVAWMSLGRARKDRGVVGISHDGGKRFTRLTAPLEGHCAVSPGGTIAVFDGGRVALSSDLGVSWSQHDMKAEGAWPRAVANGTRWFCRLERPAGLFTSDDDGRTWSRLAGIAPERLIVDPEDRDRVLCVSGTTIAAVTAKKSRKRS